MKKMISAVCAALCFGFAATGQEKISIVAKPGIVFIEQGESKQFLNFDFLVSNLSDDTLSLSKIAVSVFDKNNRPVCSRFLDNNGTAPSIATIPGREFNGKSSRLLFNPFTEFNLAAPLHKMVYEWTFSDNSNREFVFVSTVSPQKHEQKASYSFPLKGVWLVYDGHDLYAHHRRFDYEFAPIKGLGLTANFMRYSYDFVALDKDGKQFKGKGEKDEEYVGFGQAVYAIAGGKVIYASNKHKDDKTFDIPELANNALELYGNCIAILHADNSVSVYGHLKQNSAKIKVGDMVKARQEIAAVGVSGSSFLPHLHFEIRSSIEGGAEGIPSYFSGISRLEGGMKSKLKSGLVETGDIIEAE